VERPGAAIDVEGLRVVRGGTVALDDLSLSVRGACVTGLLGPSGSGKTTLMRAVVGVQLVEAGSVTVLGLPAGAPELRRRVAYMTQAPCAFARTEFQAVQFMPAAILPQLLLCGLLVPRERMADLLEWASWALPLTYAYDALARAVAGDVGVRLAVDASVVGLAVVLALALGATTLRRRTP
jgi:ABC-type cobalamin/Fe3+-siderophores transport system ATPase subunit